MMTKHCLKLLRRYCSTTVWAAAVTLLSGATWAGYDARAKELKDKVSKLSVSSDRERELLERAVEDWIDDRDECFEQLLTLAQRTEPSAMASGWTAVIDSTRSEISVFSDAIRSVPGTPSIDALAFTQSTATEEDAFLVKLLAAKPGEARDKIADNYDKLSRLVVQVEQEWAGILAADASLDESQTKVREEILTITANAIREAAEGRRSIKEKVASWANVALEFSKKTPKSTGREGVDIAIKAIEEALHQHVKTYLALHSNLESLKSNYQSLLEAEKGGIFVLFSEFRAETQGFIEKNDFNMAKATYVAVESDLRDFSSFGTSGQRSDAAAFSKELLSRLSDQLDRSRRVHDDFVSKHKTKFFGPVGPDIKDALVEYRVWEDFQTKLERGSVDVDRALRTFREDHSNWWTVSVSGIDDVERKHLTQAIQTSVERLADLFEAILEEQKRARESADRTKADDPLER